MTAKVSSQEKGANDDEEWANKKEYCGQSYGFIWNFRGTLFELARRKNI